MVWLMWAVMMAAMMLPSAVPMIMTHRRICAGRDDQTPAANGYFVVSYLVAWSLFSVVGAGLQWLLQTLGAISQLLLVTNVWLAAAILIGAGIYQFTPAKDVCLAKCRTPIGFFLTEWRPGKRGAFQMGLKHGAYCIGCCWAMMAVLFVFGVMNLFAIALLATGVAAEKLLPRGDIAGRLLGAVLVGWGVSLPLL